MLVWRYNTRGAAGLRDERHQNPGHPPLLHPEQEAELEQALEGPAPDGGLWTSPKVAAWISERTGRPVGKPTRHQVKASASPVTVTQVAQSLPFTRYRVRPVERGVLEDPFALCRVWTLRDGQVTEEWLVVRQEQTKRTYALCNAPPDMPAESLAHLKCGRFGIACANQEAKSDLGWDELQAQKYRAWEHHLALTIIAAWFIAQTTGKWRQQYPPDPTLAEELAVDVLAALTIRNGRELLKATMPLPQLSEDQAAHLMVTHLVNRARSTSSRLHKRRHGKGSP